MKERLYYLSGDGVEDLADRLSHAVDPAASHGGDGFEVMVVERSLWRWATTMQATVIVEQRAADDAVVRVVVGGGAIGLFRLTFGSEGTVLRKITEDVEAVFEELDLRVRSSS